MKYFKIRNAFRSLLISYLAILMVPLVLILTMTIIASRFSEENCIVVMQSALSHSKTIFGNEIENLKSDAMQLSGDNTLKWLAQQNTLQQGDKNVFDIMKFREKLNGYLSNSTFYHDHAVIISNGYVFREAGVSIKTDRFYDFYRKYSDLSYEEWYDNSFYTRGGQFLAMQDIHVGPVVDYSLTYSYSLMNLISISEKADVVVQFLISKKKMEDIFSQLLSTEGSGVYILDQNGKCLVQLGKNIADNEELPGISLMKEKKGYYTRSLDTEKQLVVYQKTSLDDLTYVATLPKNIALKSYFKLRKFSVIYLVISLLFELFLGFSFSIRYTVPIRNMVKNIDRLMISDNSQAKAETDMKSIIKPINDYEYLERSIEKLIYVNKSMEVSLKEKQIHEKINFLTLLYNGEFHNKEDIIREAQNIGIELGNSKYCVLLCNTDKVLDLLEYGEYDNVIACHAPEEGMIAILLKFIVDIDRNTRMRYIEQLKNELEKAIGNDIIFGIGRAYSDEVNIPFSYKQAIYCLEHAMMENNITLLDYNQISLNLNYQWYPADIEERLLNATKYGETHLIEKVFTKILDENCKKRHLNSFMEGVLLSNITATFLTICSDAVQDDAVDDIMELLSQNKDMEGKIHLLKERFLKLSSSFASTKDEQKTAYYNRLKDYMEENYTNQQLCVVIAAETFSLSESYFSQFFKEVMGDSFSNYLENIRLNYAKTLILQNHHDLETISAMVGYNNSATFRRAFKRVVGITPSSWQEVTRINCEPTQKAY